eukprot:425569_1
MSARSKKYFQAFKELQMIERKYDIFPEYERRCKERNTFMDRNAVNKACSETFTLIAIKEIAKYEKEYTICLALNRDIKNVADRVRLQYKRRYPHECVTHPRGKNKGKPGKQKALGKQFQAKICENVMEEIIDDKNDEYHKKHQKWHAKTGFVLPVVKPDNEDLSDILSHFINTMTFDMSQEMKGIESLPSNPLQGSLSKLKTDKRARGVATHKTDIGKTTRKYSHKEAGRVGRYFMSKSDFESKSDLSKWVETKIAMVRTAVQLSGKQICELLHYKIGDDVSELSLNRKIDLWECVTNSDCWTMFDYLEDKLNLELYELENVPKVVTNMKIITKKKDNKKNNKNNDEVICMKGKKKKK